MLKLYNRGTSMWTIFFWMAFLIDSMASKCNVPFVNRQIHQYYDQYGQYRTSCDGTSLDITCHYTNMGDYTVHSTDFCPDDEVVLRFDSAEIGILPGSSFKTNYNVSDLHLEDLGITKIIPDC
ncbi:unnamed protein product [Acanthoscelides obtectus]|uniref:Uncharacterized protein n=1 Tax=Acanthoscelides obtectus TaxID=200917 RepID=A0A9P0JX86_ACAOB|nr:unnamed protein product [Acanthoscelides obtectus]CAK1657109.1 hypothetical protein AOBTE_LOCUS20126 [Acanthoscelides obtectus]